MSKFFIWIFDNLTEFTYGTQPRPLFCYPNTIVWIFDLKFSKTHSYILLSKDPNLSEYELAIKFRQFWIRIVESKPGQFHFAHINFMTQIFLGWKNLNNWVGGIVSNATPTPSKFSFVEFLSYLIVSRVIKYIKTKIVYILNFWDL